jgi:hypothetical protein
MKNSHFHIRISEKFIHSKQLSGILSLRRMSLKSDNTWKQKEVTTARGSEEDF